MGPALYSGRKVEPVIECAGGSYHLAAEDLAIMWLRSARSGH